MSNDWHFESVLRCEVKHDDRGWYLSYEVLGQAFVGETRYPTENEASLAMEELVEQLEEELPTHLLFRRNE